MLNEDDLHAIQDVPFKDDMRKAVLDKRKFCTSRNKKYGEEGDYFIIEEMGVKHFFEFIAVRRHTLKYVANELYRIEGCDSPEDFVDLWISIHKRKKYDPDQEVWTHYFIPAGG